jgi:hypothetical protein
MLSRKPRTSDRVTDQSGAEVLLEHEQRGIRQGMRLSPEVWREEHGAQENRAANQRGDPSSQRHLSGLGGLQILGSMIHGAANLSSSNARINGGSVSR